MKIGITEHGDGGIDLSWVNKMDKVDGAVIVTKNLTEGCINAIIKETENSRGIILHLTCTGWGGTAIEPGVPVWQEQIRRAVGLLNGFHGDFPADRLVLRIDPIIPTESGLKRLDRLLGFWMQTGFPYGAKRVRISILDCYPHVRERIRAAGMKPPYGYAFQAPEWMVKQTAKVLAKYPGLQFETCAEPMLAAQGLKNLEACGCISMKDLEILGIQPGQDMYLNPQKRGGCLCLSCKTELLDPKKKEPCPHGCIYCFWKRPGE